MNPHFLPAHHPPKAIIRDMLCGGLEVILGGGLVIQQWSTAGLAVSLLTQAVGEGIVPAEKRGVNWRWSPSSAGRPRMPRAPPKMSAYTCGCLYQQPRLSTFRPRMPTTCSHSQALSWVAPLDSTPVPLFLSPFLPCPLSKTLSMMETRWRNGCWSLQAEHRVLSAESPSTGCYMLSFLWLHAKWFRVKQGGKSYFHPRTSLSGVQDTWEVALYYSIPFLICLALAFVHAQNPASQHRLGVPLLCSLAPRLLPG